MKQLTYYIPEVARWVTIIESDVYNVLAVGAEMTADKSVEIAKRRYKKKLLEKALEHIIEKSGSIEEYEND